MEMHELVNSLEALNKKLVDLQVMLRLDEKREEISKLQVEMNDPNFWKDQEKASKKSKKLGNLQNEVDSWKVLSESVSDLLEMAKLDEADKSVNLREDIEKQFELLSKSVAQLEFKTLLSDKYDSYNAIVSIHSGSGGTEAQDWAEMLMRMVFKYCESKKWKITVLDEAKGQEAGLKSIFFRVEGDYAYGHLKSEHGTHRLVRISPFDSNKRRHTSFASVFVYPEIDDDIVIDINPSDLKIDTYRSSGAGGQHVNKTESAVRITHIPTGIIVQCQSERSQFKNKSTALKILKARLYKSEEAKRISESQSAYDSKKEIAWGSQIRSYVLHPYSMVKDHRTDHETSNAQAVLDGELDAFMKTFLKWNKK